MMHSLAFQELRELALSKRQAGVLTIDFREVRTLGESSQSIPDDFVVSLGFKRLGKVWRQIERAEALGSIERILCCDLAYQRPLMEEKTATFIAESFLALFSSYGCHHCTNGSFDERSMLRWSPISDSTFDHGVVAFDDEHVGIIWAQDED